MGKRQPKCHFPEIKESSLLLKNIKLITPRTYVVEHQKCYFLLLYFLLKTWTHLKIKRKFLCLLPTIINGLRLKTHQRYLWATFPTLFLASLSFGRSQSNLAEAYFPKTMKNYAWQRGQSKNKEVHGRSQGWHKDINPTTHNFLNNVHWLLLLIVCEILLHNQRHVGSPGPSPITYTCYIIQGCPLHPFTKNSAWPEMAEWRSCLGIGRKGRHWHILRFGCNSKKQIYSNTHKKN